MMGSREAVQAGLLIALIAIGGCRAGGGAADDRRLSPAPTRDPVIRDIPKPAGFRLVADRSVAHASRKVRIASCLYRGPSSLGAVQDFYEEYMPSAGFRLVQKDLSEGDYILRFASETEECTVRIEPSGQSSGTVVRVKLVPLPD